MSAKSLKARASCSGRWFVLFLFGALGICRAQLEFEKKEVDIKAALSDKQEVARFPFRNAGSHTIHIHDVQTSCGCTTAALEKRTYKPGEKGEITATFDVGDRLGLQDKTIIVELDGPNSPIIALNMRIEIPDLLDVSPAALYWGPADPRTGKTVTVKVLNELPVKEVTASSSDPNVKTTVETVVAGQEFKVTVTPGAGKTDALISIAADYPPGMTRYFYTRARVR